MRDFVRFLFSLVDQSRIDVNSIQTEDIDYSVTPVLDKPYPQSFRISFTVTDPENGPIQIRPLFPGRLTFIADDTAPGVLPKPEDVEFTSTAYATWKTQGKIMVKARAKTYRQIRELNTGLEVEPNVIWYFSIKISEEFLFTTLRNGLKKATIPGQGGAPTIRTNNPDWPKHAISRFLAGEYAPELRLKSNATDDDVIAHPMPTVIMATDGSINLTISAAQTRVPQDEFDNELINLATTLNPGAKLTDPVHARNGAIPARHVYRLLRPHMIDAGVGSPLPDRILADWPNARRYFALRFTRTWQPIRNVSIHFPSNAVRVEDTSGGSVLFEQRLPAHGIIYLSQVPPSPLPDPLPDSPNIRVSILGGLRFLDGATANSWREKANTNPLTFDLGTVANPHVILRRRMSEEMLVETRYTPGGARCTYLSLRRSVRALVDNRITGGRLNFRPNITSGVTRNLMDMAWNGTPANAAILANNRPRPNDSPGRARRLEPVLEAFFPEDAPAETIDGSDHRDENKIFSKGQVAYNLWQTIESVLFSGDVEIRRNFLNAHVGRGASGALVSVSLAVGFHVDPVRNAGETDADYFDRIVNDMLNGLEPGATLQFWALNEDYENIKSREEGPTSIGHSPIFLEYDRDEDDNIIGLVVIDQFGETEVPIIGALGNRLLSWGGAGRQIWISANWDE